MNAANQIGDLVVESFTTVFSLHPGFNRFAQNVRSGRPLPLGDTRHTTAELGIKP